MKGNLAQQAAGAVDRDDKPEFQLFGGNAGRELKKRKKLLAIWLVVTIFLFIALICISLQNAEREQAKEQKDPTLFKVRVLEPVGVIPRGIKLLPRFFTLREIDSTSQTDRYIHSFEEMADHYSKNELIASNYLTKDDITAVPPPEMLESLIPQGSRAISLSVDATTGVEGWAKPGVHVDVVISFVDAQDGARKSQVIVQNAVVLSYNGQTERMLEASEAMNQSKDPKASINVPMSATVTLGVRSEDALQIRNSQMLGTISLLLRNELDNRSEKTVAISEEDFRNELSVPIAVPTPVTVAVPAIIPPAPVREKREGMIAYVDKKTGASVHREYINGEWQVKN